MIFVALFYFILYFIFASLFEFFCAQWWDTTYMPHLLTDLSDVQQFKVRWISQMARWHLNHLRLINLRYLFGFLIVLDLLLPSLIVLHTPRHLSVASVLYFSIIFLNCLTIWIVLIVFVNKQNCCCHICFVLVMDIHMRTIYGIGYAVVKMINCASWEFRNQNFSYFSSRFARIKMQL